MFRKILDRVGFEHQVGTYPYENDPSTPPPGIIYDILLDASGTDESPPVTK